MPLGKGATRLEVSGYDASERSRLREASRVMSLRGSGVSIEAGKLIEAVWTGFSLPHLEKAPRPTSVTKLRGAVSAILADLLIAARADRWTRRSLDDHSFTGRPVSRRMFRNAWEALEAAGLTVSFSGFKVHGRSGDDAQKAWGGLTCISATPRLIALAEEHGVALEKVLEHFTAGRVPAPAAREILRVHAKVVKDEKGLKAPTRALPIADTDDRAHSIRADLEELNAYLSAQDIKGFAFSGLRRVFNDGDQPGFAWQWGGRFYSIPGGDDYINWKGGKTARAEGVELQGERVAEVDISAAHLTILYTLRGEPFDHLTDPYAVPGIPRGRVKRWLLFALGKSTVAARGNWYSQVREATLAKHPVLNGLEGYGISTVDLQYHEAEVMLRAMKALREDHGVASLPVHDSLVVPASKVEVARHVLTGAFRDYFRDVVGVSIDNRPRVT